MGEVETASSEITEPRSGVGRKVGEPRTIADSWRRNRRADGFPTGTQDVRGGGGDRHALLERFRLARLRQPRSSWRHRDLWRRHAPRQRATTNTLAGWKHGARWRICPCGGIHSPADANTNTLDDIPHFRTLTRAHVHADSPRRTLALDERIRTRSLGWRRASSARMVVPHTVLRIHWHWHWHWHWRERQRGRDP
jgi:hypothetical protein